ncbi:MAG TPA: hypothetical protein VII39_13420 [Bradyrhizobium sp.]|jgi:hypothetical protein
MKFRALMISAVLTLTAAYAADAPPPLLVRGTIASIDANSVTITKADGTTVTAAVAPATFFAAVEPRRFDQIKSTDFVGITSVPGPNDTMKAEEIHLIPLKGLGEGTYPWDHHPDGGAPTTAGSMTNGTVAVVHNGPTAAGSMTNGTVTASKGMELKVTYHGSEVVNGKCVGHAAPHSPCTGVATVTVSDSTPIVAIVSAKPADAKPGLAVFANIATGTDGKLTAGSLVLEKNGIKPPM